MRFEFCEDGVADFWKTEEFLEEVVEGEVNEQVKLVNGVNTNVDHEVFGGPGSRIKREHSGLAFPDGVEHNAERTVNRCQKGIRKLNNPVFDEGVHVESCPHFVLGFEEVGRVCLASEEHHTECEKGENARGFEH